MKKSGLSEAKLLKAIEDQLQYKFGSKGQRVVDDNMRVVRRGFDEVHEIPKKLKIFGAGHEESSNGRTEVLQGQCRRSNAGLWYTNYDEFKEIILMLHRNPRLKRKLGKNGVEFFQRNYSWQVIESKYQNIINRLESQIQRDM